MVKSNYRLAAYRLGQVSSSTTKLEDGLRFLNNSSIMGAQSYHSHASVKDAALVWLTLTTD